MMRRHVLIGVMLLGGSILVGCGGGDAGLAVGAEGALGGFERAERGCTSRAEAQGFRVEGVQFTQSRPERGRRITGAETLLIVTRDGRTHPLRCRFDYRSGTVRLTSN